jgi:hypothetical protein
VLSRNKRRDVDERKVRMCAPMDQIVGLDRWVVCTYLRDYASVPRITVGYAGCRIWHMDVSMPFRAPAPSHWKKTHLVRCFPGILAKRKHRLWKQIDRKLKSTYPACSEQNGSRQSMHAWQEDLSKIEDPVLCLVSSRTTTLFFIGMMWFFHWSAEYDDLLGVETVCISRLWAYDRLEHAR